MIEHLDYGHLTIGEFTGPPKSRTRAVAREFQESGVVCRVVDNLMQERWGEALRRAYTRGTAMPRQEQLYALLKSLNARRE